MHKQTDTFNAVWHLFRIQNIINLGSPYAECILHDAGSFRQSVFENFVSSIEVALWERF